MFKTIEETRETKPRDHGTMGQALTKVYRTGPDVVTGRGGGGTIESPVWVTVHTE